MDHLLCDPGFIFLEFLNDSKVGLNLLVIEDDVKRMIAGLSNKVSKRSPMNLNKRWNDSKFRKKLLKKMRCLPLNSGALVTEIRSLTMVCSISFGPQYPMFSFL